MPLEQTKNLIKETRQGYSVLERELQSAVETRNEYNRQLRNARAKLSRKENSPYPDNYAVKYIEALKKGNIPESILIQEIDKAIGANQEFDENIYKAALYSVANTKDIYKFIKRGTGWQTHLDLQIVFEEEAGDLNDWATGIRAYREDILHSKGLDSEQAGEKATEFWYTKVFGTSLGTKTVAGRIEFSGRKAAFWQILNSGSPASLASDRAGGYNPVHSVPTDFIGHAEIRIENDFLRIFVKEFSEWDQEEKELREVIKEYEGKRDQYSVEVLEIRTEMKLNKRILDSFGAKRDFVNKDKLARAIRKNRAGEEFDSPRIDLSIAGSGVRTTISRKKFEGLI